MIVQHEGREVELVIYGTTDDPQVSECYYTDTGEEVDDNVAYQLLEDYAELVEFELFERAVGEAEAYFEGDR